MGYLYYTQNANDVNINYATCMFFLKCNENDGNGQKGKGMI